MTEPAKPQSVPVRAPSLAQLAKRINAEHRECGRAMKRGLLHALRAGELLIEAKDTVKHGQWLTWLADHCPKVNERLAQKYMQVARDFPLLEAANAARVADLSFREALRLLAANLAMLKRFDAEQRPKLIDFAEAHRSPKLRTVAERVRADSNSAANLKPVAAGTVFRRSDDGPELDRLIAKLAHRQPFEASLQEVSRLDREIRGLHAKLEALESRFESGVQKLKALEAARFSLWQNLRQQARQEQGQGTVA